MKLAHEVFLGNAHTGAAQPGSPNNSKTASGGFNKVSFQFGGNRLTGGGPNHPNFTVPKNRTQSKQLTARPTQAKLGATGYQGAVGQFITPNNIPQRTVAGSPHAGVGTRAQKEANTLRNQHMTRATARGVIGLNTTTRRGGSSQLHFVKPVAGTASTYMLPSPSAGGRGSTQLTTVTGVHYVGLHKIVVTKKVQTKATFTRPRGQV